MYRKTMFFTTALMLLALIDGCGKGGNPLSSSDTVQSGTLQYTFTSSKTTYSPGDTLSATVSVHNTGSTQEVITVGDGLFQWELINPGGDTVMSGGVSATSEELVPADSGKTVKLYTIDRVLEAAPGKTLQVGSYSLKAEVHPMSFILRLSIN